MKILLNASALALALLVCAPALAQSDKFANSSDAVGAPCRDWAAITPNDSTDLARVPKALYVGGDGDVAMIGVGAASDATGVTWAGVPASALLPARPRRVLATGTTATNIVACY